jgi:hypothetical protein
LTLALPLFLALFFVDMDRRGADHLGRSATVLLIFFLLANLLPALPWLRALRDGLPGAASLVVWAVGLVVLLRWRAESSVPGATAPSVRQAA